MAESVTPTLVVSTRHATKASTSASLCRACWWPLVRVKWRSIFSQGSCGPWNSGISTRSWPAATSFYSGRLAVGGGAGACGNLCVTVGKAAAAVGDVAKILAGIGCIGAVECDGLILSNGLRGEEEDKEKEGCLVKHGGFKKGKEFWCFLQ